MVTTVSSVSKPNSDIVEVQDPVDAFADFVKLGEPRDDVSFTETEHKILDLYDQLSELRLERAVLEAQTSLSSGKT